MAGQVDESTDGSATEGEGKSAWDDVDVVAPSEDETTVSRETPEKEAKPEASKEVVKEEAQPADTDETESPTEEAEWDTLGLNAKIQRLETEIAQANELSNFYANQLNQALGRKSEGQTPAAQSKPTVIPGQLPEGILPPSKWDTSNAEVFYKQMEGYLDHRFVENVTQARTENEQYFKAFGANISALREHVAKLLHPDFDEVIQGTIKDMFLTDKDGKILDIKNPALLTYIKQTPFPELAMYEHGLRKKAPQKIKEGIQRGTKQIVEKLGSKPKGPTQPKTTSSSKNMPELDWDTPAPVRDQVLKKKGLL